MIPGIFAAQSAIAAPDPAGDCADYPLPSPGSVVTDLDVSITVAAASAVDTNLCSEIV